MEYVVVFYDKHVNLFYVSDYPSVVFSLEIKYAEHYDDYDFAIKQAAHLTKKYNIDFHVYEVPHE